MEGLQNFTKEERPWGNFERFTLNEKTTVKIVTVRPGEAISLQTHRQRDEFWRVLSGSGTVTIGSETQGTKKGDTFFGKRGQEHRIEAGKEDLVILEIAFGDFDEQDIARLEDLYGRGSAG